MPDPVLPPKRDVALKLLEESSLFIHLDPRAEGAIVPAWFKKQPQLVLQVGLAMAVPIVDLDVGEKGISCTLSFSRQPHWCFMPWEAIFALVGDDGRGMVWPEDVPPEVARQSDLRGPAPKPTAKKRAPAVARLESTVDPQEEAAAKPAGPPRLSIIPGGAKEPAAEAPVEAPAAPAPTPIVAEPAERTLEPIEGGAPDDAEPPPSPGATKRERPAWLRVVKGGAEG